MSFDFCQKLSDSLTRYGLGLANKYRLSAGVIGPNVYANIDFVGVAASPAASFISDDAAGRVSCHSNRKKNSAGLFLGAVSTWMTD